MKAFIPTSVSRIMYAIMLGAFGAFHFMNAEEMTAMVPEFIPGGVIWIYIVGTALILATIAIITGKMARTACYLTGFMLMIFVLTVYLPNVSSDETGMVMGTMLKDFALAGAAFFMGNHLED